MQSYRCTQTAPCDSHLRYLLGDAAAVTRSTRAHLQIRVHARARAQQGCFLLTPRCWCMEAAGLGSARLVSGGVDGVSAVSLLRICGNGFRAGLDSALNLIRSHADVRCLQTTTELQQELRNPGKFTEVSECVSVRLCVCGGAVGAAG